MRLIILFFLLTLTSCSHYSESENIRTSPAVPTYDDLNVRNILGHMEISETDTQYSSTYTILTNSEKPCIGKDFVGYRDCFIENLAREQQKYTIDEKLRQKFFFFDWGLKDERSFTGFYQEIDTLPIMSYANFSGSCRVAGYRVFDHGTFTGEHFTLSYRTSEKELSKLLSKSGNFSPKSLSGIISHENPCEYWTWGPDVGNIFYFRRVGGNNYLFIKTSDGAGSGEFNYTIYQNPQGKNNLYMAIATLAGDSPLPQITTDEKDNNIGEIHYNIMEAFKNRPFQSLATLELQRTGYISEIRDALSDITPEVVY